MKTLLLLAIALFFNAKISRAQTEITFYTSMGDFVVEAFDTLQPITAGNFIDLVNAEYYDGIIFHRVINNFMIQGGDPTGTGSGGPGYTIPDEFNPLTSNVQGALAMANSGPNSGGSQFFINLVNNLYLDPNYPVFGKVISNFSVVQSIGVVPTNGSDRPLTDVVMDSVRVTTVGPHVGTNELAQSLIQVNVFPNPANDYVFVAIETENETNANRLLSITNVLGQTVYSEFVKQGTTKVDLTAFSKTGVYFVRVSDAQTGGEVVKKIVLR